jgi:hypothetical protein
MIRYKYVSIFLFSSLSMLFFACTIRVYERPYYQEVGALDFSTIGATLWAVFINMSTVGYGATYPSTGPGRFLMILATLVGAFLLSLLVSLIAVGLMLEENKKEALSEIAEKKTAGSVISQALKYNALRNLRYKMMDLPEEVRTDHCPSVGEVKKVRDRMMESVADFKEEKKMNKDMDDSYATTEALLVVKN